MIDTMIADEWRLRVPCSRGWCIANRSQAYGLEYKVGPIVPSQKTKPRGSDRACALSRRGLQFPLTGELTC